MVGLYHHQLLILPGLIQKASPQLRMKPRARCCRWGHYRDPTTHFRTSLSQLLQGNPLDCFQFSFQRCLFLCYSKWCIDCIWSNRLTHGFTGCTIGSATKDVHRSWEERGDLDKFLLMFFEFAPNGVVIFNY